MQTGHGRKGVFAAALLAAARLIFAGPAAAETALVFKSKDIGPYNTAVEGFTGAYRGRVELVNVEEMGSPGGAAPPDVAVAIGNKALLTALKLPRSVPIIFIMVLNPEPKMLEGRSFAGIETITSAVEYLGFIEKHFPSIARVGLLAGESSAGSAEGYRGPLKVEVGKAAAVGQVPEVFRSLLPKVDALLVMPDPQVLSKETIQFILLGAIEARKPVFAYSSAMVKGGAFLSLTAPYGRLGEQAAEIANGGREALRGRAELIPPTKIVVDVNEGIADRIGFAVPERVRALASEGK